MVYLLAAILVALAGLVYCVALLCWRVERWNRINVTMSRHLFSIDETLRGMKGNEHADGNAVPPGRV